MRAVTELSILEVAESGSLFRC